MCNRWLVAHSEHEASTVDAMTMPRTLVAAAIRYIASLGLATSPPAFGHHRRTRSIMQISALHNRSAHLCVEVVRMYGWVASRP